MSYGRCRPSKRRPGRKVSDIDTKQTVTIYELCFVDSSRTSLVVVRAWLNNTLLYYYSDLLPFRRH